MKDHVIALVVCLVLAIGGAMIGYQIGYDSAMAGHVVDEPRTPYVGPATQPEQHISPALAPVDEPKHD